MTAAQCPVCGQVLTVRSDDRLPRHWPSERSRLWGGDKCAGSQEGTRSWPDKQIRGRTVRVKKPTTPRRSKR